MPSNKAGTKCEHFYCSLVLPKKGNFLVCKPAPILSCSIFGTNEHNLLLFLIHGQRKGDIQRRILSGSGVMVQMGGKFYSGKIRLLGANKAPRPVPLLHLSFPKPPFLVLSIVRSDAECSSLPTHFLI